MFRSAAALFARKSAIVAITGVTVIGGATLALAVEGDPPDAEAVIRTAADCTDQQVWDADREDCVAETEADCNDDEVWNTETETCEADVTPACTDDDGEEIPCEDEPADGCTAADPETGDCLDEVEGDGDGDGTGEGDGDGDGVDEGEATEELGDEERTDRPENHGMYVSEAARGGGECAELTGRAKGQCVAGVARSDVGKSGAEDPAPAEAPTVVEQEPAPVAEATTAPAPAAKPAQETGKPAHAGGKGKGGKG